jgi:hypothetical protein
MKVILEWLMHVAADPRVQRAVLALVAALLLASGCQPGGLPLPAVAFFGS